MIPMETENDNDDKDSILVDIPIEINTVINDDNIVIDNNKKQKQKQKKTFSDEKMAKYMQEMYDLIDQDELPVYFPSEGTTPRSTFRFYKNDIREEKEEEEVITYVDADELGFFIPSEGTVPRSTYVKSSEIDEINDVESDELDDYNDSAILSSPVRNEALTIMIKPTSQLKELELKDRESNF